MISDKVRLISIGVPGALDTLGGRANVINGGGHKHRRAA